MNIKKFSTLGGVALSITLCGFLAFNQSEYTNNAISQEKIKTLENQLKTAKKENYFLKHKVNSLNIEKENKGDVQIQVKDELKSPNHVNNNSSDYRSHIVTTDEEFYDSFRQAMYIILRYILPIVGFFFFIFFINKLALKVLK